MPDSGGEYYFLRKAYGPATGFLLAWGRMTVIQTGSLALIAFILGDFATIIFDLGPYSPSIYAALTIFILTILNIAGTAKSGYAQNILTSIVILTIIPLAIAGILYSDPAQTSDMITSGEQIIGKSAPGLAMIFVLITYGGWSEAAYLSGEMRDAKKSITNTLVFGILIITITYVVINIAYLNVIGFESLRNSTTAGNDLTELIFGSAASLIFVVIIVFAALSTTNATIITGARTNYAIGRDFPRLKLLGSWNYKRNSPVISLILQALVSLTLVAIGSWSKETINTMVDYTAPVFWFFMILTTFSVFIFRKRNKNVATGFRIPMYPLPLLVFLIAASYMLYSSIAYTGAGALAGVLILLSGLPVYYLVSKRDS
jgi:amino acid transporter